jgi:hypothetical protein
MTPEEVAKLSQKEHLERSRTMARSSNPEIQLKQRTESAEVAAE